MTAALLANLSAEPNSRTVFLYAILVVSFGLSFIFTWSHLKMINSLIELADTLGRARHGQS